MLADVDSKYSCHGFPYLGKDHAWPSEQQLSEYVMMCLMVCYLDKGYNIVCDNYFTSLSLANNLLCRNTTLLGTMRQNREEFPQVDFIMKDQKMSDTKVLVWESDCTLTLYKCKPRKTVCVLSGVHNNISVQKDGKRSQFLLRITIKENAVFML